MSPESSDEELSQPGREELRREKLSQSRREELTQSRREEEIDVKPKLNLVISHEHQDITVRVKANMSFKKIFDAAAKRFGMEAGTLKFTFDGTRIQPDDTPAGLGMEENDVVDALLEQVGGDSLSIPP